MFEPCQRVVLSRRARCGVGEGVDLKVLVTGWKFLARQSRLFLRQEWFPRAVDDIRGAAAACRLSPSRGRAVVYAFNNLLASKVGRCLGVDRRGPTGLR